MNSRFFYYIFIFLNIIFLEDYDLSVDTFNLNKNPRSSNFTHLFGIVVEFQTDNDPETSGNGKLLSEESIDLSYINYPNIDKCDSDSKLVIDLPPHNSYYFSLQMEAVKNYYNNISSGNILFDTVILESTYELSNTMSYYATSDQKIGLLFAESIELASSDIESYINTDNSINSIDDVLFVVFHAGLGQEASQDFDPTIYDIRSAYIDDDMLSDVQYGQYWINDNNISNGLVMPETLNWIFYDVIEDLFPNSFINVDELENLYCDIQIGMTGLFAHLLGYHFGFPVMSDVLTGNTRIGKFGLMDVGWSNQAGIIPPRPNPWTRSNENSNVRGWVSKLDKSEELYSLGQLDLNINLVNEQNDNIFQFFISENEYFLLENRSNRIETGDEYSNMSIIDMINDYNPYDEDYDQGEDTFVNLFDVVEYYSNLNGYDVFEIDPIHHVVTEVKNYDYGLPGSGILIWHIDEPSVSEYNLGVNNDINNKSIALEEGDGIEHIGNPNYYLFNDLSKGNESDFWYANNEFYQYINYQGYDNQIYLGEDVLFDNTSIPNSRSKNNILTDVSIEIRDNISDNMSVSVLYENNDYELIFIEENIKIIGNSSIEGCVFFISNNSLYKKCANEDVAQLFQNDLFYGDINGLNEDSRILVDLNSNLFLVENSEFYINANNQVSNDNTYPQGYWNSLESTEQVDDALSLGDIDSDGFDEKLFIINGNLLCINSNESSCHGFPIYGDFEGIPLIADVLGNDNRPEIICKNNGVISVYSNVGEKNMDIPGYGLETDLSLVPNWGSTSNIALVNGSRLIVFDSYNSDSSYWLNPGSTTLNNLLVTGPTERGIATFDENGIDLLKTYNYPNPIIDGITKFRFFVFNSNSVNIRIYDASGILIDQLLKNNLVHNEYNEISWNASQFEPGLYFAEVKSNTGQTKLIKIVIL